MEIESYLDGVSFEQTDGTIYTPKSIASEGSSNGAYAFFDSPDGIAAEYVDIEIPFTVMEDGTYGIEYVINTSTSKLNLYVDDKANGAINTGVTGVPIDEKNSDGKYPVFESTWAQASTLTLNTDLTAGEHTLILELMKRTGADDIAIYLDYLEFSNSALLVSKDTNTRINFSDHMDKFVPAATEWETSAADNGVLAYAGGGNETTFTLPFHVEKEGRYAFSHVGAYSANLSDIYVYADSTENE
ncbi:MAG: hypothetical protein IJ367_04825, partial [Clostridia bacterium]|nr:hypothetical protein [Clostridia bacterium]